MHTRPPITEKLFLNHANLPGIFWAVFVGRLFIFPMVLMLQLGEWCQPPEYGHIQSGAGSTQHTQILIGIVAEGDCGRFCVAGLRSLTEGM